MAKTPLRSFSRNFLPRNDLIRCDTFNTMAEFSLVFFVFRRNLDVIDFFYSLSYCSVSLKNYKLPRSISKEYLVLELLINEVRCKGIMSNGILIFVKNKLVCKSYCIFRND